MNEHIHACTCVCSADNPNSDENVGTHARLTFPHPTPLLLFSQNNSTANIFNRSNASLNNLQTL